MNKKFVFDVLHEIRQSSLKTPIDDVNIFKLVYQQSEYEIVEAVHSLKSIQLSDFEQRRLDRVIKMLDIDNCKLGYCKQFGLYDQYNEQITHKCPKCGTSFYIGG